MSTRTAVQTSELLDPDEVRSVLERLLSSRYFVNAHKKKAFLRLVCELYIEGRASELNEYRLAFDVFDRDRSYSPSADPIVRVVAHDIRKKLELYYQNEGAADQVRLELPAGSYQPAFTRAPVEEAASEDASAEAATVGPATGESVPAPAIVTPTERARMPVSTALLIGLSVMLAMAIVVLEMSRRDLAKQLSASTTLGGGLDGPLWAPFARDGSAPLVILSNPPVLRLANATDPDAAAKDTVPLGPETVAAMKDRFVTNPEVLVRSGEPPKGETAAPPDPVLKLSNEPRLVYSRSGYTGIGEAIGLHRLTDYFRAAGRPLVLKQSRTLSGEDLKNHNVILLGGAWVNEWSGKLTGKQDFVFTSAATVANQHPAAGEAAEYIPEFDGTTGEIVVDYAVITVAANLTDANEEMILAGVYSQGTEGAAEYVTERAYVEQLNARLRELGGTASEPLYFQALLRVRVENGIPTNISLVGVHRLGR